MASILASPSRFTDSMRASVRPVCPEACGGVLDSRLQPDLPLCRGLLAFGFQGDELLAVRRDLALIVGVLHLNPIALEHVSAQRLDPGVDRRLPTSSSSVMTAVFPGSRYSDISCTKSSLMPARARSTVAPIIVPVLAPTATPMGPPSRPMMLPVSSPKNCTRRTLTRVSHHDLSGRVLCDDGIRIQRDAAVRVQIAKRTQSFVRLFLVVENDRYDLVHMASMTYPKTSALPLNDSFHFARVRHQQRLLPLAPSVGINTGQTSLQ